MYDLRDFGNMIADKVRMRAYVAALQSAVKPGDVVVDVGTGTGIFALLACQYGASRVYAIESNDNIRLAKKLAADNGFADRIEFIQDFSTRVVISEKADVVVSDLRGQLPLFEALPPSIIDARERFLKPGGILIPERDILNLCVVEASELYQEYSEPWESNPYGLNLNSARELSVNHRDRGRVKEEQMLTMPQTWNVLDYRTINTPNFQGNINRQAVRGGVAHGFLIWFDAELIGQIGFSNAPTSKEPTKIYGSTFFPFSRPVEIEEGDQIKIDIRADFVDDKYTWSWKTNVTSVENTPKLNIKQSSFYSVLPSLTDIKKRQPDYIPSLSAEGRVEEFIQREMNGENSIKTIARKMQEHFTGQFPSLEQAIERVARSSQKYSD